MEVTEENNKITFIQNNELIDWEKQKKEIKETRKNFSKKIISKKTETIYVTNIKIPKEIITFIKETLSSLFYRSEINETISKRLNKKNITLEINDYFDVFETGKEEGIHLITKNRIVNNKDIENIQKGIWDLIKKYKENIIHEIRCDLSSIEEINLSEYCKKCKHFIICNTNKEYENKKCKNLFVKYLENKDEIDYDISYYLEEIKENFEKLTEVEKIKEYFKIKIKEKKCTKEFSAGEVKKIIENKELEKTKYFAKEW